MRAKSKTIEAIQVNLVDDEPLYEYSIYLLPMGRRLKGKIPDKPQNIDTQYKEYKVNMDGKVSLMNCKVRVQQRLFHVAFPFYRTVHFGFRHCDRPILKLVSNKSGAHF